MATLPEINLISNKSSMIREWRNAFLEFPKINIIKGDIFKQNGTKIIEINANGLASKETYKHYKNLSIPQCIQNLDVFYICEKNFIKDKNLIIVPTSIRKGATSSYSTYLPMLSLVEFLSTLDEKNPIYIHQLGEMNPVSEHHIALDMAMAYATFLK